MNTQTADTTASDKSDKVVRLADTTDERLLNRNFGSRMVVRYGEAVRDFFNRRMRPYFLIDDVAVFEPATFPWTAEIKANIDTIEKELRSVMKRKEDVPNFGDLSVEQTSIDNKTSWRTFFLYSFGYRSNRNCERCPQTADMVSKIPGLVSALFSIHEPGTHLARHVGVTKAMITVHLPLIIPKNNPELCRIDVAGTVYPWRKGEWFIFDDTYDHEVWNDTEEERVNLMLHIRRPMRGFGRVLGDIFFALARKSSFIQEPLRNLEKLDTNPDSKLPVYTDVGIPKLNLETELAASRFSES